MLSRRRSYFLIPLFVALCALSVSLLTGNHVSAASPGDDAVGQSMKSFTSVYDAVEQNFADKVDADKAIYNGAIPGMLRTLDPHSNFFDPKAYAALARGSARPVLRRRHAGGAAQRQDHGDVAV